MNIIKLNNKLTYQGCRKLSTTEGAQKVIRTHLYGEKLHFYGVTVKTKRHVPPGPLVPMPMHVMSSALMVVI